MKMKEVLQRLAGFFGKFLYLSKPGPGSDWFEISDALEPRPSRAYMSGQSVSIDSDPLGDNVTLVFQRKINSTDVIDGKLLSLVEESIKRRGGKRATTFVIPYESAEALHTALRHELKKVRARRKLFFIATHVFSVLLSKEYGARFRTPHTSSAA